MLQSCAQQPVSVTYQIRNEPTPHPTHLLPFHLPTPGRKNVHVLLRGAKLVYKRFYVLWGVTFLD